MEQFYLLDQRPIGEGPRSRRGKVTLDGNTIIMIQTKK